jgi:hypothetical protein
MLREFLDAREIDQVEVIGNDSGEKVTQIFVALSPEWSAWSGSAMLTPLGAQLLAGLRRSKTSAGSN